MGTHNCGLSAVQASSALSEGPASIMASSAVMPSHPATYKTDIVFILIMGSCKAAACKDVANAPLQGMTD
jgi:hypothetical protein